jgi:MFS family permease
VVLFTLEIFPMRVRGKAVSVTTSANWAFNFALAYFVPPALRNIKWRTYMLFAAMCSAAFVHVFFCFPETKGRTLEEMEEIFNSGHAFTAWRVPKDIGKKNLQDVMYVFQSR